MKFKTLAAAAVLALAAIAGAATGGALQTTGVHAAPVTSHAAVLDEDNPAWNCLVDGNKICGPVGDDATAAWAAYDARPANLEAGGRVEYRGTAMAGLDFPPSTFYTLPTAAAGMVHVFEVTEAQK